MTESETTNPNAVVLAALAAKAERNQQRVARIFGVPYPGPDAEGERLKPIDDTQEDTDE